MAMAGCCELLPEQMLLLLLLLRCFSTKMASIPMFSVENDSINCSILSSNEMHIFFLTRFLSGTCTYSDKQAGRIPKYNLFARRKKNPLLCIYWSKPMKRFEKENFLKTLHLLRVEMGLYCGTTFQCTMLCKHMKRTNNCRYRHRRRRCRRFQVAGCENNCSIFVMQHTKSVSLAHHTR